MNRRLRRIPVHAILFAWIATTGCGDEPLGPDAKSLASARERWESAGLTDYAYTYRMSCFCPPQLLESARVSVSEGQVAAVHLLDSDVPAPPETYDIYVTIDGLFDRLARDLANDPAVFEVTYDGALGYPTSARIDISEQIADEEYSFEASDLVPATP